MLGSLFGMVVLHRRQRDVDREKRVQYWREQVRHAEFYPYASIDFRSKERLSSEHHANA
jgi:hypothetical protein